MNTTTGYVAVATRDMQQHDRRIHARGEACDETAVRCSNSILPAVLIGAPGLGDLFHTPAMIERRADIQPELWVGDGPAAIAFYERALGAIVEHRVSGPDDVDVVAQLAVGGARFWVSTASGDLRRFSPRAIGGATGRLLLVVDDPESLLSAAIRAGAKQTSPVTDEHGWRLGRFEDPFGHEWEVGRPLGEWPPDSDS